MNINSDIENKLLDIIKEILTEGYHGSDGEDTPYLYLNDIKGILDGYIRLADLEDCQCLYHGQKVKTKYCPYRVVKL